MKKKTISITTKNEQEIFDAGVKIGIKWLLENYGDVVIGERFGKEVRLSKLMEEARKWAIR